MWCDRRSLIYGAAVRASSGSTRVQVLEECMRWTVEAQIVFAANTPGAGRAVISWFEDVPRLFAPELVARLAADPVPAREIARLNGPLRWQPSRRPAGSVFATFT